MIHRILSVLVCTELLLCAQAQAAADVPLAATAFAYAKSHSAMPLPAKAIEASKPTDAGQTDGSSSLTKAPAPLPLADGGSRALSRRALCSATAAAAQANNLPVPFFANLIWQESGFNAKAQSPVGAQGIAQFMPRTAAEQGLSNPFDPVHALAAAGRFLRGLLDQFGNNHGLAAAAYNAGPRRVSNWMAKRGPLPEETRNYVMRITGRPADQWAKGSSDGLFPAKAPCTEVEQAVIAQANAVRAAQQVASQHEAAKGRSGVTKVAGAIRLAREAKLAGGGKVAGAKYALAGAGNIVRESKATGDTRRGGKSPAASEIKIVGKKGQAATVKLASKLDGKLAAKLDKPTRGGSAAKRDADRRQGGRRTKVADVR